MSKYLVTGGAGFIGSHLVDRLVANGEEVYVVDSLRSGYLDQVNNRAGFFHQDILDAPGLLRIMDRHRFDGVFHLAAIARTPWCFEDPLLASLTNSHGTMVILEACRKTGVPRVVLSSSNVVYAAHTPYRATKEMGEMWGRVYAESYGLNVISLRYSNVYGPRQSEQGPSPNVFAAFRKCYREKGYVEVTGDGEQSRDFTHVSDINRAQIMAMHSKVVNHGLDLCTGKNWTMNQVVRDMFRAPINYIAERAGDVKHIVQDPRPAFDLLGWRYSIELPDGIKDVLQ
jgi:UDP-glucose 4-epimerase